MRSIRCSSLACFAAVDRCLGFCSAELPVLLFGVLLQSLSHPGIPQYIDYFEEDTATDRAFYIVQVRAVVCMANCIVCLAMHRLSRHPRLSIHSPGIAAAVAQCRHCIRSTLQRAYELPLVAAGRCAQSQVSLRSVCCVCVQEVVQGSSLSQMVSSGKRASEDEVLRIATDLLATLKYLAGAPAATDTLGASSPSLQHTLAGLLTDAAPEAAVPCTGCASLSSALSHPGVYVYMYLTAGAGCWLPQVCVLL